MPNLSVNGIDLHFADSGEGEAVVFLNGLAGDHLYWMRQVRFLCKRFRCLAIDNRDTGRSSYVAVGYTIADLAADVVGLLDALAIPSANLVGLSLGGMIAQEAAVRWPDRVKSLFLSNTLPRNDAWFNNTLDAFTHIRRQSPDTGTFFEALLSWLVGYRYFENVDRVEWLKSLLHRNPHQQRLDGFLRQIAAIRQFDVLDRLKAIRCPTLVVVGEDDAIAPPRLGRRIAEEIPTARLEVLAGIGHAPPIEDSERFNRLLAGFLQEQLGHGNSKTR